MTDPMEGTRGYLSLNDCVRLVNAGTLQEWEAIFEEVWNRDATSQIKSSSQKGNAYDNSAEG